MEHNYIVDKLILLRDAKNLTNYQVAKICDLPISTVRNIYNRKTKPQIDTLDSLCKGFGITLSQFFSDDDKYAELTESEINLLKSWSVLDSENKTLIQKLLNNLINKKD